MCYVEKCVTFFCSCLFVSPWFDIIVVKWASYIHDLLRIETGVREGDEVSVHYDPMIAKVRWYPIQFGGQRSDVFFGKTSRFTRKICAPEQRSGAMFFLAKQRIDVFHGKYTPYHTLNFNWTMGSWYIHFPHQYVFLKLERRSVDFIICRRWYY